MTAIVAAQCEGAWLRVAGAFVVERLVIALWRAGARAIVVVVPAGRRLRRADAYGVRYTVTTSMPAIENPVLLAAGNLIVDADDLRALLAKPAARLLGDDGRTLPCGVASAWRGSIVRSIEATDANVRARRPTALLRQPDEVNRVERIVWAQIEGVADGIVDRFFNRPLGRPLARMFVRARLHPNVISLAATAIGLWACALIARGDHAWAIAGALILQASLVLDCIDGDVARAMLRESHLGWWLDIGGDQVVHVALFGAIATGLYRAGSSAPVVALGSASIIGALIAFGTFVYAKRMRRSDDRIQRAVDALASRDFSVLVVLAAVFDRLDLFLWCAAVGVQVFWLFAAVAVARATPAHEIGQRVS